MTSALDGHVYGCLGGLRERHRTAPLMRLERIPVSSRFRLHSPLHMANSGEVIRTPRDRLLPLEHFEAVTKILYGAHARCTPGSCCVGRTVSQRLSCISSEAYRGFGVIRTISKIKVAKDDLTVAKDVNRRVK